jgi:hypothetical protein
MMIALLYFSSCEYDSYPDDYGFSPSPESFSLKGYLSDADSLWPLQDIKVFMKPAGLKDTLMEYTDSSGVVSFKFFRHFGSSAVLLFQDTTGIYDDTDTTLFFSGRDFNAGLREFFVNL